MLRLLILPRYLGVRSLIGLAIVLKEFFFMENSLEILHLPEKVIQQLAMIDSYASGAKLISQQSHYNIRIQFL